MRFLSRPLSPPEAIWLLHSSVPPRPSSLWTTREISRGVAYRLLSQEGYRVLETETCGETFDALRLAQGRVTW